MNKKILMSGYYGFKNAGDEAVCQSIIEALKENIPDGDITVLSGDPAFTAAAYGVKAVDRWKIRSVLPAILHTKILVSGGGSLIQDVTSRFSSLYYLGIIFAAEFLHKKVVIYSQGIGPLEQPLNRTLTRIAFNHAQAVFVRDDDSAALLKEIGVKKAVTVVPDPVLAYAHKANESAAAQSLLARLGRKGDKPLAILAPRRWQDADITKLFSTQGDMLAEQGYEVAVLAMHYGADSDVCKDICNAMSAEAILIDEKLDLQTLFAIFAEAELVSAMRLHALIIGAALEKKLIAVSYDPKVTAFMQQIGVGACLPLKEASVSAIVAATKEVLAKSDRANINALCELCLQPAKAVARLCGR